MDLLTGFIIYLAVFRLAIITAGVVSIIAGYMLFKQGLSRGGKTEIEGQAGEYRLTVRNAAPGTCFALFGMLLVTANFVNGGPGLTIKNLEKVSDIPTLESQQKNLPESPKKNSTATSSRDQSDKSNTPEDPKVKGKISTPSYNTKTNEKVTELIMKGSKSDDFRELVEKAKAFERNNQKIDAIRSYEKALFFFGEPMNNLACLYLDTGNNDQAVLLAHLAVTISADQAGFHHTYAMSLLSVGNIQDALQAMAKAARLNSKYENNLNELRRKYEKL